jgi:glycosyltransferase involved in cell wall biosynthesis
VWVRCAVRALFREIPFDCVVNFSYLGEWAQPGSIGLAIPRGSFRYIYDLIDNHVAGYALYGQHDEAAAIDAYLREQIGHASAVVVTSAGLQELVRVRYGRNDSVIIPNGYYEPSGFAQAPQIARDLRRKWGWEGRTVLGYVGSLDGWVNVEFLSHVFQEYRKTDPDACLLVVGGGPGLEFLRVGFGSDPRVRITGWVPSTGVEPYFALLDVGLIPFEINVLTMDALPIKTLEYLCWGKPVVAPPLNELKRLAFPNVFLTEMSPKEWAALVSDIHSGAMSLTPHREVMERVRNYLWERLAETYEPLLYEKPSVP